MIKSVVAQSTGGNNRDDAAPGTGPDGQRGLRAVLAARGVGGPSLPTVPAASELG